MTWQLNSPHGALLYPAVERMPFVWRGERDWVDDDWTVEDGAPALDADHSLFGGRAIKFDSALPCDLQHMIRATFPYDPDIWGPMDAGPLYIFCWAYPEAGAGDALMRLSIEYAADSYHLSDFLLTDLRLNEWQLLRLKTPALSPTEQAYLSTVNLRLSFLPNGDAGSGSGRLWIDGVHFGRAVDLQDLSPDPALFDSPLVDKLTMDVTSTVMVNGRVEKVRFAQARETVGRRTGSARIAYFDDEGLAALDAFWEFVTGDVDGLPKSFTLIGAQAETARNLLTEAVITTPKRGVERLEGTMLYSMSFGFREGRIVPPGDPR